MNDAHAMGQRIRQAREAANLSQKALGQAVGVSRAAVSQWETGDTKGLKPENLFRCAAALGVDARWLASGEGNKGAEQPPPVKPDKPGLRPIVTWESPDDLPSDEYVLVQRRRVKTSAGEGALVFEEEEGPPLAFATHWIKREQLQHRNLVIVEATGDSMEPGIRDGDSLLVDLGQTDVVDGRVYVIRYRDELRVKRLFTRYDGALILRSDNHSKYPDEPIPPEHLDGQVEVIGRVVWRAGGVP